MRTKAVKSLVIGTAIVLLTTISGCAGGKVAYTVPEEPGEKVIAIQASSFRFEPNEITAKSGSDMVLQVQNTAGTNHNLTLEDPTGKVLLSLALPAGKTVAAKINLDSPGTYTFFCNKTLHSSMGMTGTIAAK